MARGQGALCLALGEGLIPVWVCLESALSGVWATTQTSSNHPIKRMRTEAYCLEALLAENKNSQIQTIDDSNGITASKQFISEGSQNKKPASIF
jgi:hypothetical protein